jgi:hypothetical protein
MDRKARPGRRGECVRGLLRCLRAAQPVDMAAFGVQFRCKIDSPARPLAPSLAVICVWQMLQGSVGTGSAQDDVRKLSKSWLAYAHEECARKPLSWLPSEFGANFHSTP